MKDPRFRQAYPGEQLCAIDGCGGLLYARDVCRHHYNRNAGAVGSLPITHDCPRCEDGGLVVPFDADEHGRIKTYRCVVRGCWTVVRSNEKVRA